MADGNLSAIVGWRKFDSQQGPHCLAAASAGRIWKQMLRKLLVKFGSDERERSSGNRWPTARAHLSGNDQAGRLLMIPLIVHGACRPCTDRIGFTVEDRSLERHLFCSLHRPQTDTPKEEKGLMSKLMFWKAITK